MTTIVTVRYHVDPAAVDAERLSAACDHLMDELVGEAETNAALTDPTVGGAMALGEAEASVTVSGELLGAILFAVNVLWRAAFGTPLADAAVSVHAELATAEVPAGA